MKPAAPVTATTPPSVPQPSFSFQSCSMRPTRSGTPRCDTAAAAAPRSILVPATQVVSSRPASVPSARQSAMSLKNATEPAAVEPVADAALARLALVVVVAGRARLEEVEVELGQVEDRLHPGVLGLLRHLDRPHVVVEGVAQDVGGVPALLVEGVREVRREPGLLVAEDEQVREAAGVHPVQRRRAVLPLLGQRQAVAADDLAAGPTREVGADLEAGGVDQAVDLVLRLADDDTVLGDAVDAAAVGVRRASRWAGCTCRGTRRGSTAACRTGGSTASALRPCSGR